MVATATKQRVERRAKPAQKAKRPVLRFLDQQSIRSRKRKRNVLLAGFFVVILALFLVAYAQAQLVSSQQDLDVIRSRTAELTAESEHLRVLVNEASAPNSIVAKAEEIGMILGESPVFVESVRGATG